MTDATSTSVIPLEWSLFPLCDVVVLLLVGPSCLSVIHLRRHHRCAATDLRLAAVGPMTDAS